MNRIGLVAFLALGACATDTSALEARIAALEAAAGTAGTNCWDLNENGLADAEEDVNGDSAWDVLDCRGADGDDGDPGDAGMAGADGRNCWDANENGVADTEEDVNGDTVVDVADCFATLESLLDDPAFAAAVNAILDETDGVNDRLDALEALVGEIDTDLTTAEGAIASLQSDVGDAQTDIGDLQTAVSALQTGVSDNGTAISDLGDDVTDIEGRMPNAGLQAVGLITGDLILEVPGDYATINDALDYLDDKRIARGAEVVIQVADGTYTMTETIDVRHPEGARIFILGSLGAPANVVLEFPEATNAVRVGNGYAFGGMDGITLRGPSSGSPTDGFNVEYGAVATVGPDVIIEGFMAAGVRTAFASSVIADGVTSQSNRRGFVSTRNAVLEADNAIASSNTLDGFLTDWSSSLVSNMGLAQNNGGAGVTASAGGSASLINFDSVSNGTGVDSNRNSHVFMRRADVLGNGVGLYATASGTVDARLATIDSSSGDGVQCEDAAVIDLLNADATNGGGFGIVADTTGLVNASGATLTGNTSGESDPVINGAPDGDIYATF